LALPFYFESALRGHTRSMHEMVGCYNEAEPQPAPAFQNFWIKIMIELGDTMYTKEERLAWKKDERSVCANCGIKGDSEDMTSKKWCGGCRYYSYCGKDCQTYHWKEEKHRNECRQVILLRKYCKPSYIKEIRDAITDGQDPKEIHTLQRLRMKLGLNRPKEEYEELLLILSDDDINDTNYSPNRYEYLVGRNDGTFHIGSTPNVI